MNLHQNQTLFRQSIIATAQAKNNLSEVLVEKDYWVCYVLKMLSLSEHADRVIFKGGTSLSKAYDIIDRFSEDVDLAVITKNMTGSKVKSLIRKIEKDITATDDLTEVEVENITSKKSKFRKTFHQYPRVIKGQNFGQASDKILLEINSFTNPYPFEPKSICTYISDFLKTNRDDYIEKYELESFEVKVLSLNRTFCEKLMGMVRESYSDDPLTILKKKVRHVYDLHMLIGQSEVRKFMEDEKELKKLIDHVRNDDRENNEFRGEWLDKPLLESPFLKDDELLNALSGTYGGDFKGLVFGELPLFESVVASINDIKKNLYSI